LGLGSQIHGTGVHAEEYSGGRDMSMRLQRNLHNNILKVNGKLVVAKPNRYKKNKCRQKLERITQGYDHHPH
jgi:hypothetical protein